MKYFLLFLIGLMGTGELTAQKNQIQLNKAQDIEIITISKEEMDMGMLVTSETEIVHRLKVIEDNADHYQLSGSLKKVKFYSDRGGKEMKYDSEVPADRDSPIAMMFGFDFDNIDTIRINKKDGSIPETKKNKEEEMENEDEEDEEEMLSESENFQLSAIVKSAFFPTIQEKKLGSSWTEKTIDEDGLENTNTYTFEKLENNIATVQVNGSLVGTEEMDEDGMSMKIITNNTHKGTIWVDTTSFQVKKREKFTESDSTMEMMGEKMPLKGKSHLVIEYK